MTVTEVCKQHTREIKEVIGTAIWINMGFKRTNSLLSSKPECDLKMAMPFKIST
jgi:hypothetical protein